MRLKIVSSRLLSLTATQLETAAGITTVSNASPAGYWKRIAAAAEYAAGATTTANSTMFGYMKRAAVALESLSGTSGTEKNTNEPGYMKRIIDALESLNGASYTGSLPSRMNQASQAWQGYNPATLFSGGEAGIFALPSSTACFQDAARTTPSAVGDPVGGWTDSSGRANHLAQATAAARPILRQEDNLYYLECDGADDYMRALFEIPQPFDRISALRQVSWTLDDQIFGAVPTGSNAFLRQQGGSPNLAMWGGAGAIITVGGATIGTNVVVTERHAVAGSRGAVNNGAYATGTLDAANPKGITIGAGFGAAGGNHSHIRLYGVLMIARSLTAVEITRVRNRMARAAGVSL